MRPEIGKYWLKQYFPCQKNNVTCLQSPTGYQERAIEFKKCPQTVDDEIAKYYQARNKIYDFTDLLQCVDDTDLYIQGDPFAWSQSAQIYI